MAEGKSGLLRVAYMAFAATELMPSAVLRFRQAHPHIDVRLEYIRTQGQKIALANGDVDIGYLIGPFERPDFTTLELSAEPLHVVTPHNHPLLLRPRILPADLAGQPMILGDLREWEEDRWRLSDLFSGEGIALRVALEASNTLALNGLVAAGLGALDLSREPDRVSGPRRRGAPDHAPRLPQPHGAGLETRQPPAATARLRRGGPPDRHPAV